MEKDLVLVTSMVISWDKEWQEWSSSETARFVSRKAHGDGKHVFPCGLCGLEWVDLFSVECGIVNGLIVEEVMMTFHADNSIMMMCEAFWVDENTLSYISMRNIYAPY